LRVTFVDAGGWLSVIIRTDRYHVVGSQHYRQLLEQRVTVATSDFVLDEVITRLRYDVGHSVASQFIHLVRQAEEERVLHILHVDQEVWYEAEELFLKYSDVKPSFTDCTSLVLLRRHAIEEVFGFDQHLCLAGCTVRPVTE